MCTYPFRNENLPLHERIDDLIARLTVEEKVLQLTHDAASVPRLGIRSYNYWNEALHGVARAGIATVFPQAIGLAATFHPAFLQEVASVISDEARAKYNEFQRQNDCGIYKGLTFWSPNINIFRDPRWGRGHETYGEDPYLTSRLGVAFIKGIQGDDPQYLKAAACAKHFAVHSGPEKERHHFSADISDKELFETYLPAFEACVKEGGVEAVMSAYNALDGTPCSANTRLLQTILRERWGFDGHVVSDCGAIADLFTTYCIADNKAEAVSMALKAGCDLNCGSAYQYLLTAYKEGFIEEADLDKALRHVLRSRFKLGMFDNPEHVPFSSVAYEEISSPAHVEMAREAARQSLVLLKNDGILPLRPDIRMAVIGPNAHNRDAMLGNYNGTPDECVTVLDGVRRYMHEHGGKVLYAEGSPIFFPGDDMLSEAVSAAQHSDVVLLCLGLDSKLEGEEGDANNPFGGADKPDLNLPASQQKLLETLTATGKPIIVLLLAGSALAVGYAHDHAAAVIDCFYPGQQGGNAVADLLFGRYSPSGRMPITFYASTDDLPPFTNYSMQGRTYRYMEKEALYPFGYGLSYTSFAYRADMADRGMIGQPVTLSVSVKNTGTMPSFEHIQVYIKADAPSVSAPRWALKELATVYLEPGEEKETVMTLSPAVFSLIDEDGSRFVEPGVYTVYVGGQQPDKRSEDLTGQKPLTFTIRLDGERTILEN